MVEAVVGEEEEVEVAVVTATTVERCLRDVRPTTGEAVEAEVVPLSQTVDPSRVFHRLTPRQSQPKKAP